VPSDANASGDHASRAAHGPKSGLSALATVSEAGFEDRMPLSRMPTSDLTEQYAYANNPRRSPRAGWYSNVTRPSHTGEAAPHTDGGLPGSPSMQHAGGFRSSSMQHGIAYTRAPSGLRSSMEAGALSTTVAAAVQVQPNASIAFSRPPLPPSHSAASQSLASGRDDNGTQQQTGQQGEALSNLHPNHQQQQGSTIQYSPTMDRSSTQSTMAAVQSGSTKQ
jgi:hypothetical protein